MRKLHFHYPDDFTYPDAWKSPVTKGVQIIEGLLYCTKLMHKCHVYVHAGTVHHEERESNNLPTMTSRLVASEAS